MRAPATGLCLAWLTLQASTAGAAMAASVVGLVPSADAGITAALGRGLRLAFVESAASSDRLELVVARGSGHWDTATAPSLELLEAGAAAIVTPPDRFTSHLVAQLGTRAQVPVITTTAAPSIRGTGSRWVFPAVRSAAGESPNGPIVLSESFSLTATQERALALRLPASAETRDRWVRVGYAIGLKLVEAAQRRDLAGGGTELSTGLQSLSR